MSKTKTEERKGVSTMVDEFLKKGGKIEQVPIGATRDVGIRRGFHKARIVLTSSSRI